MASSLIGGLIHRNWNADNLVVADPAKEQRQKLTQQFGITCFADNAQCVCHSSAVVLAVKPQFLKQAVDSIAISVQAQKPLLISIAAGIRCQDILRWGGGSFALVRAMPNTPALVNAGISALFATAHVNAKQRKLAQSIMQSVGETLWVETESLLDVVTGISGSGPAYFFKLMEQMVVSAEQHGLAPDIATKLVVQTALGAATLAKQNAQPPATLRAQVTSRGGTTEAALNTMESLGLDDAIQQGITAAVHRAAQMADQFAD